MIRENLPAPQRRAYDAVQPYRVHFIVTHKCNLACAHCYQAEHDSEDLTLPEAGDVLAQLADLGVLHLTLGGGEPLARRDFWELLAEARRLRFAVQLYTNGTLVTPQVARRLREEGVADVSVSLHGAHAQTHDAFVRRAGAFDRINRAVDALEAVGMPVSVKSSLTTTNWRETPLLRERFAGRPLVKLSVNAHVFPRDDGDRTPVVFRTSEEQERAAVRGQLAAMDRAHLARLLDRAALSQAAEERDHVPCQAARTAIAIHPNGDVTPCTQTAGFVMGNVRQRRLRDIWGASAAGDTLRRLRLTDFSQAHEGCASCDLRKVCGKCPAMSWAESGSLSGYSPQVCQSTKVWWTEVRRRAAELELTCPV